MFRALLILAVIGLLFFGRGMLAGLARQMATREISDGAITRAQQWLAWSLWLQPGDGTTELMQAACHRHLKQETRWVAAMQAAKLAGAAPRQLQLEMDLALVRAGRMRNGAENQLRALIDAGAAPRDVATAFVYGYLRREEPKMAEAWINALAKESPRDPQVAFLHGIYFRSQRDSVRAQAEFEQVLNQHPGHELARAALAEMAEEKDHLRAALDQYVETATRSPACENALVGMARIFRTLGEIHNARAVLTPLAARPTPSADVRLEMGHIELESGNYALAQKWFWQVDREEAKVGAATAAALMPFSPAGGALFAERLFDQVEAIKYRSKRVDTLKVQLAVDPGNKDAVQELQRRPPRPNASAASGGDPRPTPTSANLAQSPATSGADLYALYCAACHGENGDGNGPAARHLHPRPQDLRRGKTRLVSTLNGAATLQDLEAVTKQGMPGTAMRAYDMLTEQQQTLLAKEVLRLHRAGVHDQIVAELTDDGEEIEEDEIRAEVTWRVTPGQVVQVPQIGPADAAAIARGKDLYLELGCHQCHGAQGMGEPDKVLFDANGRPTRPRDLAHEPLKGGQEPESLFLRIFLGMPGTDHPACSSLTAEQVVDLVQYCRSLAQLPQRMLTNHERSMYETSRAYVEAFGTAQ